MPSLGCFQRQVMDWSSSGGAWRICPGVPLSRGSLWGGVQAAEEAERRRQEQVNEREREAQRKLEAERRAAEQRQRAVSAVEVAVPWICRVEQAGAVPGGAWLGA